MSKAVQITEQYIRLSNERDLDTIRTLFTPSSTYSSDATGIFLGVEQIMEMQSKFFALFPYLRWDVQELEEVKPGVVRFTFTLHAQNEHGEDSVRQGVEHVVVFEDNIQHVEVRSA